MATRSRRRGRGTRRAPLRKFVWARSQGFLPGDAPERGLDLLGQFQQEYGAQLLGATVVRIRGFIVPANFTSPIVGTVRGTFGVIVGKDTDDYSAPTLAVEQREHDDWLAYLPWAMNVPPADQYSPDVTRYTSNVQASPFAVDIKSSRKIEELGQTLQLWRSEPTAAGGAGTEWHLSMGLKLP